jgi:tetratricopeptide (TPR) repeat protein
VRVIATALLVSFVQLSQGGALQDPKALYEQGVAERDLGFKELDQASAPEQEKHRTLARKHFQYAARHFGAAASAFAARVGKILPQIKELPLDLEWSACARCAQAEMDLQSGQIKEARAAVAPFLADAVLSRSRYRDLALYEQGLASFLLGDLLLAGQALNRMTSFTDPRFGTHARYLLARVHHLSDERREAVLHYEGVLAGHEDLKKKAAQWLRESDRSQKDPVELVRWQALLNEAAPPHVGRANLCLGMLYYGDGRFDDARACFLAFQAQQPQSPLRRQAQVGLGACLVQLNQCAEAVPLLRKVADKQPQLAGQALLWLGRAQLGLSRRDDPDAYREALKDAWTSFRHAADRQTGTDPKALGQRGTALLELAETLQLAGQDREAAQLFARIAEDRLLPRRAAELLQRRLTALHRAGDYEQSDLLCWQFLQTYPHSVLTPEVLFRHAENAHFLLLSAEKKPERPERAREVDRLNEETTRRCQTLIERFPEFEHVQRARQALAMTHHRRGAFDKAREILEHIPASERKGDLVLVSYLLADCLLRQLPVHADDAVAAGRLTEQLKTAIEALTHYIEDLPEPPLAADALMRLGYCQQRLAALVAQEAEQKQLREQARGTFEQVLLEHPGHELAGHAALERARCLADGGDVKQALARLYRFTTDPLRKSPLAPLAILQLATLVRGEDGKAAEAVRLLEQCRQQHEVSLLRDPARRQWAAWLPYQQALALREAGKPSVARALLERVRQQFPDGALAAAASLRWGQCLADEGRQKIEQAEQRLGVPEPTPEETAQAEKDREAGRQRICDAAAHLDKEAQRWQSQVAVGTVRAFFLYEAAWLYRRLGEQEVEAARVRLQEARPGEPPEVLQAQVPLQPAEKKARALYQRLFTDYPDLEWAHYARLELGELYADRGDPVTAGKLFNEALDKEPPADITDKLRLRLGASHQARGDGRSALQQYETITRNADSGQAPRAHLLAGELMLQSGEWTKAIEHVHVFLDQEKFQDQGPVTERGLLLLGHALGRLEQWEASRRAYETLLTKFTESAWLDEARYGLAWTWWKQAQPEQAAKVLSGLAVDRPAGARGQLLLGVCRLEQKHYAEAVETLLAVAGRQGTDEVKALALVEAAYATARLERGEEADKLLQQVIRDHAKSSWAEIARTRLKEGAQAAPHTLPAGVRQLAPVLPQPPRLEALGEQQPVQTPVDDPVGEASAAVLLQRPLPERATPAPLLRLTVADPFEHRDALSDLVPAGEELLTVPFSPGPPR